VTCEELSTVAVGALADWLVVVVKFLLGAVGAERRGRIICGWFVESTGFSREEPSERVEVTRQVV
jgi:hypothetical protein